MTPLEKAREEIEREMSTKPSDFNQHDESNYDRGLFRALLIIDKYIDQDNRVRANVPCRLTENVGNGLKMSDGVGDYPTDTEYDKGRTDVLEKIRKEILNTFLWECEEEENLNYSVRKCLEIIKKYEEQEPTDEWQDGYDRAWELAEVFYEKEEPTSPCDLCGFNTGEFCEYLSDCPAMAKGGE